MIPQNRGKYTGHIKHTHIKHQRPLQCYCRNCSDVLKVKSCPGQTGHSLSHWEQSRFSRCVSALQLCHIKQTPAVCCHPATQTNSSRQLYQSRDASVIWYTPSLSQHGPLPTVSRLSRDILLSWTARLWWILWWQQVCFYPSYMSRQILKKISHGKPIKSNKSERDLWHA